MKLKQVIYGKMYAEGTRADFFWGFSYWDRETMQAVCYPIPLNWVVAIARNIYWKLMFAPDLRARELNEAHGKGYEEGYEHGYKHGYNRGYRKIIFEETLMRVKGK